jgi:hypothetical protein
MKTLALSTLSIAIVLALGACGSQSTLPTPDQLRAGLNDIATITAAGCTVVQPTLVAGAAAAANPVAGVAAGVNGVFCAAQGPLAAATAASAPAAATAPASAPAAAPAK